MKDRIKVDLSITTANQLVDLLKAGNRIERKGFNVSADDSNGSDEVDVWVTNPYGIDCAMYPLTEQGCDRIRHMIESYVDLGESCQLEDSF